MSYTKIDPNQKAMDNPPDNDEMYCSTCGEVIDQDIDECVACVTYNSLKRKRRRRRRRRGFNFFNLD